MHINTSGQAVCELGFHGQSCNWGTHICGLYETPEERDEILVGYLGTGCLQGDLQLYAPSEQSVSEFEAKVALEKEDCLEKLHDPSIFRCFPAKDLYYPDGRFSPDAMDRNLSDFYEESQMDGKRNIRATGEMAWALESIPGVEHLMVYESRLNFFIPDKPWISICLYNLNSFSDQTIMQVLRTHPYTINRGIISQNPYYQDPADWLRKNAPGFIT